MPASTPRVALDEDRLSDILSTLARKHQVPGAQLAIYQAGETLTTEIGELEHGTGRLVDRDTAFPIGSISKSFTATVAMMLVADDDLELDAPVGKYLPELGNTSDALGAQLTLRQLLSHTSGLVGYVESTDFVASSLRRFVLDNVRHSNLVLPPGTGLFSYSELGYSVAGHLIEVITGMAWCEAMESMLLRPLGIEPTFLATSAPRPLGRPMATGHSVNPAVGRTRPVEQNLTVGESPSGGLATSAEDLVKFGLIQLDGHTPGLLPPAYTEQMRQAIPSAEPFGMGEGYGLGLAVFSKGNTVWVGHDGGAEGTACFLRIDPINGHVVAFTCNANNTGLDMCKELVIELRRTGLIIGNNYSSIETLGPPTSPPPDCVGSYLNGVEQWLSVTAEDNGKLGYYHGDEVLSLHEGLILSFEKSGQRIPIGRFLRDPITGDLLVQLMGLIARNHEQSSRT